MLPLKRFLLGKARPSDLLCAAGVLTVFAIAAGWCGKLWWRLELASHVRVQYLIILFSVGVALLAVRRVRAGAAFLVLATLCSVPVAPMFVSGATPAVGSSTFYRAVLINVHTANQDRELVVQFVKECEPDFVLLEEVNAQWIEDVDELNAVYPYVVAQPRSDNFGIALFSKHAFSISEIVYIGDADVPSILARLDIGGRGVTVLGAHTLPPVGKEYSMLRNDHLARIPEVVDHYDGPFILMGDLNVTPWSPYFGELQKKTGLVNSSRGHGIVATWPTDLWPLRIPIDHFLHTPDLIVLSKKRGPAIGSDHFPLIVDFAFAQRPASGVESSAEES